MVPALMFCTIAPGLGLGLLFGVLNVFVRDINQVMVVILQLWFWLTSIVYMISIVPPQLMYVMRLNPMYWIVTEYQALLVYGRAPDPMSAPADRCLRVGSSDSWSTAVSPRGNRHGGCPVSTPDP